MSEGRITPEEYADSFAESWGKFWAPVLRRLEVHFPGLSTTELLSMLLTNHLSYIVKNTGDWVADSNQHWEEGREQREQGREYFSLAYRYMKRELGEEEKWRPDEETP